MLIRRSHERGHARHGWLDSHHTFSFADYYDPRHMGFGALRVINEDRVAAGEGFPTHGHRDMEILSYVLAGGLEHRDSMGNGSVLRPGHVQRMSAGTGVRHSEYNASQTDPVHFLQIWIEPASRGTKPGYEERIYSEAERQDTLRLIASRDGRDGSVQVHQDLDLFATLLAGFSALLHRLTGQDDMVIGVPAAGQAAAGLEGLVGHCVHMLPLRLMPQPDMPFDALIEQSRGMLLRSARSLRCPHVPASATAFLC